MVAAVVGPQIAHFMQIGDGAIVIGQDDGYMRPYFWPDAGEYANMTYDLFLMPMRLSISITTCETLPMKLPCSPMGFKDWHLYFQLNPRNSPFFTPMLNQLRNASTEVLDRLSEKLTDFLDSDVVNQRTDDDKTLILATRRASEDF